MEYDFIKWLLEDRVRNLKYLLDKNRYADESNKMSQEKLVEIEFELKKLEEQIKLHDIEEEFE